MLRLKISMKKIILGKKVRMTRVFDSSGSDYPATLVMAGPCFVTQLKDKKTDGYNSVQVGFLDSKNSNKPMKGKFDKLNLKPLRFLREFATDDVEKFALGEELSVDNFELDDLVSITGTSKGKGFTGHMKRHGFGGGRRSHGKNSVMRKSGSIGAGTWPGRVWKGSRMAGRSGNDRVTVKNLKILQIDSNNNLLLIKGSVPGSNNSLLIIKGN